MRIKGMITKWKLGYSRKNPHTLDGWQGFLTPPPTWISWITVTPPPTRISKDKDPPSRLDFHYFLRALNGVGWIFSGITHCYNLLQILPASTLRKCMAASLESLYFGAGA